MHKTKGNGQLQSLRRRQTGKKAVRRAARLVMRERRAAMQTGIIKQQAAILNRGPRGLLKWWLRRK